MPNTTQNSASPTPAKRPRNTHGASRAISQENLQRIKTEIRQDGDLRMLLVVALGSLTMRIGDILTLKFDDLYGPDHKPMDVLRIREKKTSKNRILPLSGLHSLLIEFMEDSQIRLQRISGPIFLSQRRRTPITRTSVNRILAGYARRLNIIQLSTHSFRKGSCRFLVIEKKFPICVVQEMLQHSSDRITARYIDVNRGDVEKAYSEIIF